MLSSRSRQRVDEAGGQDAHEAGEADQLDAGRRAARGRARRRTPRGRGSRAVVDQCAPAIPARRARSRPKRSGPLLTTSTISALAAGGGRVASSSACRLEPPPEIRTATRRRAMRSPARSNSTRGRPGAGAIAPDVVHRLAVRRERSAAPSARAGSTTSTMPMPQLKVRSSSSGRAGRPAPASANTGGSGHAAQRPARSTWPSASTRGRFSTSPPPVMCASALTPPAGDRREAAADVDPGRRQQRLGRGRARAPRGSASASARPCSRSTSAHQREAVGVHARRGEAQHDVAGGDQVRARQRRASRSTAPTANPARSKSPRAVQPRHLGGLAADQRAAGLRGSPRRCRRPPRRRRRRPSLPVAK